MDPYIEILQAAVDKEIQMVGFLFTKNRVKAVGIYLDDQQNVQKYQGTGESTVKKFIEEMEKIGGESTKKVIIDSMKPVLEKYPEIKLDL